MKSDGFGIMYESDSCFSFGRFAFGVFVSYSSYEREVTLLWQFIHAAYFVADVATRSAQDNMPTSNHNLGV